MINKEMRPQAWMVNQPDEREKALAARADELRCQLRQKDASILAQRAGAVLENGNILLHLFNQPLVLSIPDLACTDAGTGKEVPVFPLTLLLYYLATADGSSFASRWISFAELPDGRTYDRAYQGYTGDALARQYGVNLAGFQSAAQALGGTRLAYGDAAYSFLALPRVMIAAVLWKGDDEFPAAGKVLFDASVVHYLPTDVCAILGSMLVRKLHG